MFSCALYSAELAPHIKPKFCSEMITKSFYKGTLVTPAPFAFPKDSIVHELGSGWRGGIVYRVQEVSGETYILKKYHRLDYFRNDEKALAIIQTVMAGDSDPPFDTVSMKLIRSDDLFLAKLQNTEGWDLNSLSLETHVQSAFRQARDTLYRKIKNAYYTTEVDPENLKVRDKDGIEVNIRIHPGNVVFDRNTFRLTIIDPY